MNISTTLVGLCLVAVAAASSTAQVPLPFRKDVAAPSSLASGLRHAIEQQAGAYPFKGYRLFGQDSALLVFEDSSLTAAVVSAEKWMFGPPVTAAEADSCPPEKVLGRKLARIFWRGLGKPSELQYIIVAVIGAEGIERWTAISMYFLRPQLDGRWAGDPSVK